MLRALPEKLARWGLGGSKVGVEVGVASPLKPIDKANYAGEVGEVGVIQQLCETNIGSASGEAGGRQKVRQYT